MTEHSKLFSPSSAERWMHCTESPYLNLDRGGSSAAANEGSAAHKLGELVLSRGGAASDWVGQEIDVYDDGSLLWTVGKDMAYFVQDYVDYCVDQIDPMGTSEVEQKFDLTHIAEGMFGTGDFCAVSDEELVIVDLKYGRGIKVDGKDNPQLKIYALGAIEKFSMLYDFDTVRTVVFQPRLEHISEDTFDLSELEMFGTEVKAAATAILAKENLVRKPSKKGCKWCNAKGTCGEYADLATHEAREVFAGIGFQPTKPTLTNEDRGKALSSIPLLRQWMSDLESAALDDIEKGIEIPGWKVVLGRSNRAWGDADAVLDMMKKSRSVKEDDYVTKKLLTVAALEKVLKKAPTVWKRVVAHVVKPEGKHTLVPEGDKRESIGSPADQFKDIPKTTETGESDE